MHSRATPRLHLVYTETPNMANKSQDVLFLNIPVYSGLRPHLRTKSCDLDIKSQMNVSTKNIRLKVFL